MFFVCCCFLFCVFGVFVGLCFGFCFLFGLWFCLFWLWVVNEMSLVWHVCVGVMCTGGVCCVSEDLSLLSVYKRGS